MAERGLSAPAKRENLIATTRCGAPRVPTCEPVAGAPGGSGWIPVPTGAAGPPAFLLIEQRQKGAAFQSGNAVHAAQLHIERESFAECLVIPRSTIIVTSALWPTSMPG